MSFAAELKDELCKDIPEGKNELHALLYGYLLYSHKFSNDEISFSVAHEPTARLFAEALAIHCGISAKIAFHERSRGTLYKVTVDRAQDRKKIMDSFYHSAKDTHLRINRSNIENDECLPFFLRGVFLVCGSLTDPEKNYHLEFGVNYLNLSKDLLTIISEVLEEPKTALRRGTYIVYYKESEKIEDILTFMGASMSSLELMNVKILKDIKNRVNRRMNCDNANMDKTINASIQVIDDINYIFDNAGERALPDDLLNLAKMRVENPDMSLRELGENTVPKLSRSGVNHRLHKIEMIALSMKKNKTENNT